MLLSIGTILSTGTASLLTRMSLKENSRNSLSLNGDQLTSSLRNSPARLLPTSDLAGLGLQRIKTKLPLSTHLTLETLWPATTNLSWLLMFGNTLTTLTTEMPEEPIFRTLPASLIGNLSTKTSNLTRWNSNSDRACIIDIYFLLINWEINTKGLHIIIDTWRSLPSWRSLDLPTIMIRSSLANPIDLWS